MLTVTDDPAAIVPRLDGQLAADPVRHTILGSIRSAIVEPDAAPWAAATAGSAVAVRSHAAFPVVLAGAWRDDELAELRQQLRGLADLAGVNGSPAQVAGLRLVSTREPLRQRLFRLDELIEPTGVPGRARRAGAADRQLVIDGYRAFGADAHAHTGDVARAVDAALAQRGCWLWEAGGRPVSLAIRRPAVAGSARIGPVYPPPQWRGRGYAAGVTAAASRDIRDGGAIPVLFTDLANPVSNSIYPKLGYRAVEDRVVLLVDRGADSAG